jgi:hypothetical protein
MQPTRSTFQKAAALVIIASVIQAMSWWMLWDDWTFGPKGAGTHAIAAIFGQNAFPGLIAIKLDSLARAILLLALAVLTFGSMIPEPTRRYGVRRYSPSPIDEAGEFKL